MTSMRITKRLDTLSSVCIENASGPALFSMPSGDIALIGRLADDELRASLPEGSGIGDGEELVEIPRDALISAGWTPPEE